MRDVFYFYVHYPRGLKGEDIPLEGRIVILADQYDALPCKRPYKPPFDRQKTFKILTEGDWEDDAGSF